MSPIITIVVLLTLGGFISAYAETTGSIEVQIKNFNNDLIDSYGVELIFYQDNETTPFKKIILSSNPQVISSLPLGHTYHVEVIRHGILSETATGIVLDSGKKMAQITIPNDGGIKFKVTFADSSSPVKNSQILVKSSDNRVWVTTTTNSLGETGRFWLQSTPKDDFYFAQVVIDEEVSFIYSPIKLASGQPIDILIKTPWPKMIEDLISINVYNQLNKVTQKDGTFKVELYNLQNQKVLESKVSHHGSASFSKIPVGTYVVKALRQIPDSSKFEVWGESKIILTGKQSEFEIYKHSTILQKKNGCNCVAFRLDDVQDFYLSNTQTNLLSLFEKKQTPLTIGIIGGVIGHDKNIVNSIQKSLDAGLVEIANHSWDNQILPLLDKKKQTSQIMDTSKVIRDTFGVVPRTFIPPENLFDDVTLSVLKENNFTHFSASYATDFPPYPLNGSTFYRFPEYAHTGKLNASDGMWNVADNQKIMQDIIGSINKNGYAVVMMHPMEFSLHANGEYQNNPNIPQIENLSLLIDEIKKNKLHLTTISQINLDSKPLPVSSIKKSNQENTPTKKASNCNCVSFRMDNIQDFWLNDVQLELIETFQSQKIPITVGVLGKFFGDDQKIVFALNDTKNSNAIIANAGWEFVDHSKFTKPIQYDSIKKTQDKISSKLGKTPSIFIPPLGQFNSDTIDVLSETKIKILSSSASIDKLNPQDSKGITHIPQTNSLVNLLEDDPFLQGTITQKAMTKITNSISQNGFVVIHFQASDFALKDSDGKHQNKIDTEKVNNLKTLLSNLKEKNFKFVELGMVPRLTWESSFTIPEWIKNNSLWWSENKITDSDFVSGIEYLINQKIIQIPIQNGTSSTSEKIIPQWIKNNAGWWSNDMITDGDFVKGLEYLIQKGVIKIQ